MSYVYLIIFNAFYYYYYYLFQFELDKKKRKKKKDGVINQKNIKKKQKHRIKVYFNIISKRFYIYFNQVFVFQKKKTIMKNLVCMYILPNKQIIWQLNYIFLL